MKNGIPPNKSSACLFRAVVLTLFAIIALLAAILPYRLIQGAVTGWEMTSLGGAPVYTPTSPSSGDQSTPGAEDDLGYVPSQNLPAPNPWDGASRVTVLVMGLDYRDWQTQEGPPRTDSMILVTIDPLTKTAGMLSIPRDLWVNIPGMGYNKINTAYRFGELYKVPGGGPGLAMQAVREAIGVPIDFYAQIDFNAFVKFINKIGGIDLDVPQSIDIDPLGPGNTIHLKKGRRHLNGSVALAYARNRYTENDDYDRSNRQHQVIMAVREKVLAPSSLPLIIARSPELYQQLNKGVHTNMTLEQAVQLAWLAQEIPTDKIKAAVIGPNEVIFGHSPDGLDIDKPIAAKIRLLRDQVFPPAGLSSPVAGQPLTEVAKAESARLSLINSSGSPDKGQQAADSLKAQGLVIAQETQSAEVASATKIILHSSKPYTLQLLVNLFSPASILTDFQSGAETDIEIILGQ